MRFHRELVTVGLTIFLASIQAQAELPQEKAERAKHDQNCKLVTSAVWKNFQEDREAARAKLEPVINGAKYVLSLVTSDQRKLIGINRGDLVFPRLAIATHTLLPVDHIECKEGYTPQVSDNEMGEKMGVVCVKGSEAPVDVVWGRIFVIQSTGTLRAMEIVDEHVPGQFGERKFDAYKLNFGISLSVGPDENADLAELDRQVEAKLDSQSDSWPKVFKKQVGMDCPYVAMPQASPDGKTKNHKGRTSDLRPDSGTQSPNGGALGNANAAT